MEKLTDDAVLQAVRDSIAIEACQNGLYHIPVGRKEIATRRYARHTFGVLVSSICLRLKECPSSKIRSRIKRIAEESGFTLHQYRPGACIRIHTTREHSDLLEAQALKWWESMGYCQGEARPTAPCHRLPESEAELLEQGGVA